MLLLALSETEELLEDIIVASNDDRDETLFSAVFEFVNVEVEEVCDCGISMVELTDGIEIVALLLEELFPIIGLLFLSIAGECSSSELVAPVGGVGLGGTAVAVGLSRPLLRRCSTT